MAVLRDLPPELLELVYHFLGSIDDVHHFGRACKKNYDVIRRQQIYLEIMRSIIKHSPQHRYDYQLCKMLNLHKKIVLHFEQSTRQLPATQIFHHGYTLNDWEKALLQATTPSTCESSPCLEGCLPDEMIYDILARYQGLRVLEDMWLERQLEGADFISVDDTPHANRLAHSYQVLLNREEEFRDGDMPARSSKIPEASSYTKLDADQRGRFHAAVVCVWLLNEIRWVLTNFAYPTHFNVQISVLEDCKENIAEEKNKPLLEELDQYAVFGFLYHHLLPLYGTCLANRDSSKLPNTFCSDFAGDDIHCTRLLQLFLTAGQTYLQPPDLIDLVVRSKISRTRPYPPTTLPATTETWMRPSHASAFPPNLGLRDDRYKRRLQQASLTHLSLIMRSSFHQTQHNISQGLSVPSLNHTLYNLKDDARFYFADRAMVAFELHEHPGKERMGIREIFPKIWNKMSWSVWWWANSEEKARAKMERWRSNPS